MKLARSTRGWVLRTKRARRNREAVDILGLIRLHPLLSPCYKQLHPLTNWRNRTNKISAVNCFFNWLQVSVCQQRQVLVVVYQECHLIRLLQLQENLPKVGKQNQAVLAIFEGFALVLLLFACGTLSPLPPQKQLNMDQVLLSTALLRILVIIRNFIWNDFSNHWLIPQVVPVCTCKAWFMFAAQLQGNANTNASVGLSWRNKWRNIYFHAVHIFALLFSFHTCEPGHCKHKALVLSTIWERFRLCIHFVPSLLLCEHRSIHVYY